jgi:hypothetical protein
VDISPPSKDEEGENCGIKKLVNDLVLELGREPKNGEASRAPWWIHRSSAIRESIKCAELLKPRSRELSVL